ASGRGPQAARAWGKAVELGAGHPGVFNELAWLLATSPVAAERDPSRAVALARMAVGRSPQAGVYWNTLGAAHYRAGDCQAAVGALNKSVQLRSGGDAFDWFFLAMAHWKLGNKDEARKWYDRAAEWMDKNRPTNEE